MSHKAPAPVLTTRWHLMCSIHSNNALSLVRSPRTASVAMSTLSTQHATARRPVSCARRRSSTRTG
eukprot:7443630-Pyramimonas_sp.AAC.1